MDIPGLTCICLTDQYHYHVSHLFMQKSTPTNKMTPISTPSPTPRPITIRMPETAVMTLSFEKMICIYLHICWERNDTAFKCSLKLWWIGKIDCMKCCFIFTLKCEKNVIDHQNIVYVYVCWHSYIFRIVSDNTVLIRLTTVWFIGSKYMQKV